MHKLKAISTNLNYYETNLYDNPHTLHSYIKYTYSFKTRALNILNASYSITIIKALKAAGVEVRVVVSHSSNMSVYL